MTFIEHVQQAHDMAHHVGTFLADPVPNPGGGVAPAGIAPKVLKLLQWTAWLASAACVGGLIFSAGRLAISFKNGESSNVASLGWVLIACVVIGSASAIVGALI
jgi:hypothetical protein